MAGVKIDALPVIPVAPTLTDLFPEVQPAVGGTTYKVTFNQLLTLYQQNIVTPANGGVLYTDATQVQLLAPVATAGKVLQSGANAAPTWSIPTYPSTSGTSGKFLISNGTNNVYSTSTIPTSAGATVNKILLSDGTNYVLSTPTFPNASATSGKIIISDGTNWIASTSLFPNTVGSAGTLLRSNGTTNAYSTSTFADTYAVSTLLYASGSNAVSGLTTVNSASLVTSLTGVPTWLGPLTNGQLVIGSTGAIPVAANLSAGSGISISSGAGAITISGTGSGIGWTEITGTTQTMVTDNGYVANNAGLVTLTMPATAAFGTAINVMGKGAGGWSIAQPAGVTIHIGSSATTGGVGGSISSTNQYDSLELICITANTTWEALSGPQGNLTIV